MTKRRARVVMFSGEEVETGSSADWHEDERFDVTYSY